nr:serine/threonine-protein kinase [Variovorax terrae]
MVRVLGKGAMGIVYEGRDPNLDRRVAIKTVKVENLSDEAAAEYELRFRTEARSAARLQHPHIVSVYDSDRDGDTAFLVMEYIQGDDLKHHLDKGVRYSLGQTLEMVCDLLDALDYAHRQGIVHRDIKPANMLIEASGRIKLTDFGVARIQDSGEATRTRGAIVGTLKYMSPEQVRGLQVDARTDLFSAGVVLYQLLTDRRPFDGDNDFSIIHRIINHTPEPPSEFNAGLPHAMDAVMAKALAKNRDERYASAGEFAEALRAAARQVENTTFMPPVDPLKQLADEAASMGMAGAATASAGHATGSAASATSASASTVTQELELVYWKDVKDSTDPAELQVFLRKFPSGIYAELADRRLKKLLGSSPQDAGEATRTLFEPRDGGAAPSEADVHQAMAASASPQAPGPAAAPARKPWVIALASLAMLVLAGSTAWFALKADGEPSHTAGDRPAGPASAARTAGADEVASGGPVAALPVEPAVSSAATAASADKPKGAASQAAMRSPKASAPALADRSEGAKPVPAPVRREAESKAATLVAGASAPAASPRDACENRLLLAFQICMAEQCAKPAFQSHPICVERQEMDRKRRESQMQN